MTIFFLNKQIQIANLYYFLVGSCQETNFSFRATDSNVPLKVPMKLWKSILNFCCCFIKTRRRFICWLKRVLKITFFGRKKSLERKYLSTFAKFVLSDASCFYDNSSEEWGSGEFDHCGPVPILHLKNSSSSTAMQSNSNPCFQPYII